MDDEIESYSPAIENELLENNQEPTKNLTEELGYNLNKPLLSSNFGLNTNTLSNFNKNSLASLPQVSFYNINNLDWKYIWNCKHYDITNESKPQSFRQYKYDHRFDRNIKRSTTKTPTFRSFLLKQQRKHE